MTGFAAVAIGASAGGIDALGQVLPRLPADYPVPVVDHTGHFQGWATFHLTGASQGGKSVTGYFKTNFVQAMLTISSCSASANDCPRYVGSYVLKLVN